MCLVRKRFFAPRLRVKSYDDLNARLVDQCISYARAHRHQEFRAHAERIEIRQYGRVVGNHARSFGRDQTVFDPWHDVPVLARKSDALRNGVPFKDWVLPSGLERIRRKLA